MAHSTALNAAKSLVETLDEVLKSAWYDAEHTGKLPQNAEEFANFVLVVLTDTIAGGTRHVFNEVGMHENDPRNNAGR